MFEQLACLKQRQTTSELLTDDKVLDKLAHKYPLVNVQYQAVILFEVFCTCYLKGMMYVMYSDKQKHNRQCTVSHQENTMQDNIFLQ